MLDEFNKRIQEALIRATIWAFVGSLYGMIFIFFYNLTGHWSLSLNPLLVAGILAATIGAMIYSSMSLAVIVTTVSSMICLFYVISNGDQIDLQAMIMSSALAGAITGVIYALTARNSRIFRADIKALAGVSSGAIASLFFVGILQWIPNPSLPWIVALICLLSGSLYVTLIPFYVLKFKKLLPTSVSGALAGAGTGVFIALLFFVMISGVTPEAAGSLQPLTEQIRNQLLTAALGGLLGGGLSGFVSGMLLRQWRDI